jgi:SpoVK/Ycf46/Vps4 family AAA+-type ATPase
MTETPTAVAGVAVRPESRAAKALRDAFDSGRPLTYIQSTEEMRVARVLREVAQRLATTFGKISVWTWTLTEGLSRDGQAAEPGTQSARGVLDFIVAHDSPGIFHLKDFHEPMRETSEIRRRVRDLYASCQGQDKYVVITAPVRNIPDEVERSMLFLEIRPPDLVELVDYLREQTSETDEGMLYQVARALQGLTLDEARYALRRARVTANTRLGPDTVAGVMEEKRLLVNRSGVIEYISTPTNMGDVGGLEGLKKWLRERQRLFEMRDSLSAEIVPKGLLVMGIPGCGKSLCVKAMASHFDLPLYRVDMIEIFSGRHGKPERAFAEACRMLEDVAPAVLWFDEIEMGITSSDSGGEQGRIFAFFLTWMQEKTKGLFVAATANRVDLLPAEMLRKGRFDEVFFVDLPLEEERIEIFRLHLLRREEDPAKFDLDQLKEFTIGWTGAEVEQCVIAAVTKARLADRQLTLQDLVITAANIVPLSRTMKEQIAHIRNWAFERAVRASPRAVGSR